MRILVTGSSGWLGRFLVPRLRQAGHHLLRLDSRPGPTPTLVASITHPWLKPLPASEEIEAVVHAAALHKPDIARRPASDFVAVNVEGTLRLLEAAVAAGVGR